MPREKQTGCEWNGNPRDHRLKSGSTASLVCVNKQQSEKRRKTVEKQTGSRGFNIGMTTALFSIHESINVNLQSVSVDYLQHVRTVLWFLQQSSLHHKPENLLIGQTLVGLFCQSGNLPQHHPKRPKGKERGTEVKLVCLLLSLSSSQDVSWKRYTQRMKLPCVFVCVYMDLLTRHQSL